MAHIAVLDQSTINKIAAGEVIERPASVVKELLENAIDAKATAVTVEIRDGGISFIRVTDNGGGIAKEEVPTAFLRHSTSKISSAEDLFTVASLGFRGEALSSIAAVAQVELITKTPEQLSGVRYQIEGGKERALEEVGAPDGTTFLVRNLFYNTPVRQKFLKTAQTEGAHVAALVEKIAMSHPDISVRFIQNNQNKLHTSGNHNLKDIIYTVFGREIAANLLPVELREEVLQIRGFAGKPVIARSNRNFENYYINGRYVRSGLVAKAIEEAYKPYMMQHKYPFVLLHLDVEPEYLDVNVHPTKMELRFRDEERIFHMIYQAVSQALSSRELIPQVSLGGKGQGEKGKEEEKRTPHPEPFEVRRRQEFERKIAYGNGSGYASEYKISPVYGMIAENGASWKDGGASGERSGKGGQESQDKRQWAWQRSQKTTGTEGQEGLGAGKAVSHEGQEAGKAVSHEGQEAGKAASQENLGAGKAACQENLGSGKVGSQWDSGMTGQNRQEEKEKAGQDRQLLGTVGQEGKAAAGAVQVSQEPQQEANQPVQQEAGQGGRQEEPAKQLDLFEAKLLEPKSRLRHKLIGQLFDTYWLVEFNEQLYIIDQHAAHEKVLYEKTMKSLKTREYASQLVSPPIILNLGSEEQILLEKYKRYFMDMGFEIEPFGGREYAIRAVPDNLFSIAKKELLMEMLDGLSDDILKGSPDIIYEKVASMSCKAAVKGNHRMSPAEADHLIDQLLELDNPYACPHGRPTIIAMSKYELEKKFKRIV